MALDVLRAAGRHPDAGDGRRVGASSARRRQAFDVRPLAETLEKTLRSPATPSAARASCAKAWRKIAALAALAEANRRSPRSTATRGSPAPFAQFGTADLGTGETALMDRALVP